MAVLEVLSQSYGARYLFHCPGCKGGHFFECRIDGGRPSWSFDGNMERPTVSPSILVGGVRPITDDEHVRIMQGENIEPEPRVCHSFIRCGRIEFLSDCTHELAGKTVDLPELD